MPLGSSPPIIRDRTNPWAFFIIILSKRNKSMKRRADGRFQKRITLPNGKSKVLYSTAKTEREAVKDFNRQMLALEAEQKNKFMFSKIADEWDTDYRKRISDINYRKNTRAAYERIIEHFNGFYIEEMTAPVINQFINKLVLMNYSKKTVANHLSILNMIFKFAILNGYITYNVMQDIPLPQNLPQKRRKLPSDKELEIVNNHHDGFDFLPYFLLNTGLRMSEALALNIDDIDFENKVINVNKHLIHDGNKPVIENKTKTAAGERTVILLDRVAEKIVKKKGILFCDDNGTPYTKGQLRNRWSKYQKKYNITLTAHQLRHGFATMLFEAGIDEKDAQELMGHSDITTTRTIYTHIRNKRREETARKLNEFRF